MSDQLQKQGSALENQFFSKLDAQLLDQLKASEEAKASVEEFQRLTGIQDPKALEGIVKLGVTTAAIAALRVYPLVAVAWADGHLDEAEKAHVVALAYDQLKLHDSPAGALLDSWLSNKPADELFDAWEAYAKALIATLSESEAESLKDSLIKEIIRVANASGGFLGWSAVSRGESEAMTRIEAALTRN